MTTPESPDPRGQYPASNVSPGFPETGPPGSPGHPEPGAAAPHPSWSGGPVPYQQGGPAWPAPGYAGAGYGGPPTAVRPGQLTAAAILGFVVGGLVLLGSILAFAVLSTLNLTGFYTVIVVLDLILGAALIWAGIQAMGGKDTRFLVIIAGALIVLQLIGMIQNFQPTSLIGLLIAVLIVYLALQPVSKAWVTHKGGKTF